ncbi:MAG: hypothetical protein H0W99_13210 [Acidobacteria bacterium]|nr:hypothetical protein [Acidobacteriota bacterium]
MAFYIVVHHSSDPNQLWANEWEAQTLLRTITTPKNIGVMLAEAKANGERIFVHRCAWNTFPAEICCSALVSEVHDLDKTTALIRFTDVRPVGTPPPVTPHAGQSSYDARPPE